MKVAILLPSLNNKGPIIVARNLVNEMVTRNDVECEVFYFDPIEKLKFNCPCTRITSLKDVDFDRFDILHTHLLRPDVKAGLRRRRLKHVKLVSTVHSYMKEDLTNSYGALVAGLARKLWCFILNRYDRVVCLSQDMVGYYSGAIRPELLTYIYNGRYIDHNLGMEVPHADTAALTALRQQYAIIGGIGNITKIKGFEQLVHLLAINPRYGLVIIGDGVEKQPLEELAVSLGVEDRCLFLGYRANATAYYQHFDLYAMSSYSEGMPLVLMEAASNGLPTVCSDIPIFKELFDVSEVVFFELYNIEDLSRAMDEAIEKRETLSGNIRRKFINSYTAAIMCNNYLALYQQLLSPGQKIQNKTV